MVKSLYDISWKVSEEEYRGDSALSYSTLATYERVGFNGLSTLKDRKDTPSLTFGSAVDSIITGGEEEFNSRFMIADFPEMSDTMLKITKRLFELYGTSYNSISDIPANRIKAVTDELDYGKTWKTQTILDKVIPSCSDYYSLLFLAENKTILSSELYGKVISSVRSLKESDSTKWYFADNNPFDDSIQRFYQLKFKATLDGISYRCMADLIIVDHTNKKVYLIDLKTSSHTEWEFHKSFVDWNYMIQARLYYRIIKANLEKDDYFKDFKIEPYRFIVVNKETLTPLVWLYPSTFAVGELKYGRYGQIICRDPEVIGKELSHYLNDTPIVPDGINKDGDNNLLDWLNTL